MRPDREWLRVKHFAQWMGVLALLLPGTGAAQIPLAPNTQVPLPPKAIPKFVQPLPLLDLQGGSIATSTSAQITLTMCEFPSNVLPPGTVAPGVQTSTWTWGYVVGTQCPTTAQDTYIGPVVVATRHAPTEITWVNQLGSATGTNVLAWKYSTDQTLHWADPNGLACMEKYAMGGPPYGDACAQNYLGPVPAVPHLHGGEVPPGIDGSPDSWFTSDGSAFGHKYYSFGLQPDVPPTAGQNWATYRYPNTQEAGPLWFHDHTLGATRLNVYAGLAGAYFLVDPAQPLPPNLQGVGDVIPLVIQDRAFDTAGQLYFPAANWGGVVNALNPEHPYWNPEFVGDTIAVNGKVWPFANVEAKRYRFLFLNGSNARTYELFLVDTATKLPGPPIWVIGTDGGYLDSPQMIDPALGQKLVIMPGERYEAIIDFGPAANTTLLMRNTARMPYPGGAPVNGSTMGQVLQFRVGAAPAVADTSYDPAGGGAIRDPADAIQRLVDPLTGTQRVAHARIRQLTLNEVMGMPMTGFDVWTGAPLAYPGGPLEVLVNNTKWSGAHMGMGREDFTPITVGGQTTWFSELPREGETELWEIVNLTADAHPIHLHLVQFQLLNRQRFDVAGYTAAYDMAFPGMMYMPGYGPPMPYSGAFRGATPLDGGNPEVTRFLRGPARLAAPQETGWKDTVLVPPGMVTRFVVRWAPTGTPIATPASQAWFPFDPNDGGRTNYVWHCHIIDHEDNEMMRPTSVQPNPAAVRTVLKGTHY